jgi:hypothetical protein
MEVLQRVVTVDFGSYMNGVQWLFSTERIEDLTSALVKAGVSCQLKFLEGEGDRDKVVIYDEARETVGLVSREANLDRATQRLSSLPRARTAAAVPQLATTYFIDTDRARPRACVPMAKASCRSCRLLHQGSYASRSPSSNRSTIELAL